MKLRLILAAAILAVLSFGASGAHADDLCAQATLPVIQAGTCVPLP